MSFNEPQIKISKLLLLLLLWAFYHERNWFFYKNEIYWEIIWKVRKIIDAINYALIKDKKKVDRAINRD